MKISGLALALVAAPLFAAEAGTVPVVVQASPAQPDRIVTMTGEGIVKAMPNTTIVSGGVVTRARYPHDAAHENIVAMQRAVAALKALGITEKQITTSSVRFEPQYELDRHGNIDPSRRITGYTVTHRIIVTLTGNIEQTGEVFDTLIQNGADDSADVRFELRNVEDLENQARTAAAKNALLKAQVYAKALGLELGAVRLVSEGGNLHLVDAIQAEDIGRLPDRNISEALQRIPGVQLGIRIEASEQTITKTVTITWGLK